MYSGCAGSDIIAEAASDLCNYTWGCQWNKHFHTTFRTLSVEVNLEAPGKFGVVTATSPEHTPFRSSRGGKCFLAVAE